MSQLLCHRNVNQALTRNLLLLMMLRMMTLMSLWMTLIRTTHGHSFLTRGSILIYLLFPEQLHFPSLRPQPGNTAFCAAESGGRRWG